MICDMKPIPLGAIRDVKEVNEVSVESMAGSADCTGSIGAGNIIKLGNKIIVAFNIAAIVQSPCTGRQGGS